MTMPKPINLPLSAVLLLASFSGSAPLAAAVPVTLTGNSADFEAQLQSFSSGGLPSTSAVRGSADSLRVLADPFIPGVGLDEGRPVFQFDLAALAPLAAANPTVSNASLRLTLLDVSAAPEFGVEAWGRDSNLAAPITAGDPTAGNEFGASAYAAIGGGFVPTSITGAQEVSLELTNYLNDRYQEYRQGGDNWVVLRLQPDGALDVADAPDTSYGFASADHSNAAFHPEMDLTLVPEPTHAGIFVATLAGVLVLVRRRAVRNI